jgi:sec-independent protein translocase protein TatA
LIVVLAILLFGSTRIAGLGKALGRSIREFKGEIRADDAATPSDQTAEKDKETNG